MLGGCCFRTPKGHMDAGAKINLRSVTQGRRGLMSYQVLVSAEGPVHTLCKLSSTSYRTACSYTSRVVRERLCWKRSHQPLFLQEDQECARSALLCFCGRPWAQLQRAPQSKPRGLVIAVQLRRLDTKGLPCSYCKETSETVFPSEDTRRSGKGSQIK